MRSTRRESRSEMPKRPNIPKIQKRIAQIRHDLEYEYDYFRVKEFREELQLLERQIARAGKCRH